MDTFSIIFTETALADLDAIDDARTSKAIRRKIDELVTEPGRRGEELRGDLKNYRKLKAARRYRVIYQVASLEGSLPSWWSVSARRATKETCTGWLAKDWEAGRRRRSTTRDECEGSAPFFSAHAGKRRAAFYRAYHQQTAW